MCPTHRPPRLDPDHLPVVGPRGPVFRPSTGGAVSDRRFSTEEATTIGDGLGMDWSIYDVEEFRRGLEVEMEHGSRWGEDTNVTKDDVQITGRIALAHLKEIKDYYTRLDRMEAEAEGR
jgi:hypothetical protein